MKNGLIINSAGTKYWYKDDLLHREDGPAIEWSNGDKFYYINGKYHREDGPAREWSYGYKEYWLNNKKIKASSDEEFKKIVRLKSFL